ncbi:MAG: starch synthase [Verrucomicrobiales bacterium]|jgi:starch synthase
MSNPRILVVTPEITYLPSGMGNLAQRMNAKAGGLADVSASLVAALFEMGADVHVALPNYRRMFHMDVFNLVNKELRLYHGKLPADRIHLAEDRIFYYRDEVYSSYEEDNTKIALIFQREVINNIIPRVQPDLIHCNDWMTGLIPGLARRLGIPCLFTVHNIHSELVSLEQVEDIGIDAAEFWESLYYQSPAGSYEHARREVPVDMLASGIFASHYINSVSPSFLHEVAEGQHAFVPPPVQAEMANKLNAGCAHGILNAPDASFNPETDSALEVHYNVETHVEGKLANKREFQKRMGLELNDQAPLFFWPSRLDPMQKGCELLTDILFSLIHDYGDERLQIAVVANGQHQVHFHDVVRMHDLEGRVSLTDFDESLSRLGYAASDFMLMPSRFEPCGLPQMVSTLYGTLPIVHATGGLKDTISHLDVARNEGNGFAFEFYDTKGFRWAIDQAMQFYRRDPKQREAQIARIMKDGQERFNHEVTAKEYFDIYEKMLRRPLTG